MAMTIDPNILEKYEPTIGLEIHVQLDTKSKMFCRCDNNSETAAPNTNVCEVCMGYPGTLPVANAQAMEYGARLAAALGCKLNGFQRFDRKNYFYPDLPKGYQISQFFYPVGEHGDLAVDRRTDGSTFNVGITRLHLEEDAGKLTHTAGGSLVDLNRCGTPLAEIVTGPDIHTPEDAREFMQELQRIVRALGVSKADMEKGHMRVDGNISVRLKGETKLGSKVEIKNMNSFRFLEQALSYEIVRQIEALERGEAIVQETRGWDEKTNTTVSQRIKEGSVDYRYFPDPDLPPTVLSAEQINGYVGATEMLPRSLRELAKNAGLTHDRVIELQDKDLLVRFAELWSSDVDPVKLVNLLVRDRDFDSKETVASFFKLVADHQLSATAIMQLYDLSIPKGVEPAHVVDVVKGPGEDALDSAIREIVVANAAEAARYRAGETKLLGFFVGQVMAKLQGGDPAEARAMLEKILTESE